MSSQRMTISGNLIEEMRIEMGLVQARIIPRHLLSKVKKIIKDLGVAIHVQKALPVIGDDGHPDPVQIMTREKMEEIMKKFPDLVEELGERMPVIWEEGFDEKGNPILFTREDIESPANHFIEEDEVQILLDKISCIPVNFSKYAEIIQSFPKVLVSLRPA